MRVESEGNPSFVKADPDVVGVELGRQRSRPRSPSVAANAVRQNADAEPDCGTRYYVTVTNLSRAAEWASSQSRGSEGASGQLVIRPPKWLHVAFR